ncbi:EpsG family protein [Enterococcus casseliflavus]|uniref:EpsG family protein n=1 Tax=Enterococcus casseliflavus TaxID=37734 RepID=UPI002952D473|nr:EpsG family protein [Enterococcus casseliflavus]MDV7751303.1 EpsG family protein [Enterococcus casseliflavus]
MRKIVYAITFLFSYILVLVGQTNKNKYFRYFCFSVGIVIPSLIAAFRDYTVGTDVLVYGNPVFFASRKVSDFSSLVMYYEKSGIEKGYLGMNYLVSKFTDSPQLLYFFIEMIILIYVVLSIKKFNSFYNVGYAFPYLCYMLLFYGENLNMMRQSIAVAISVFVFFSILEKHYFIAIINFIFGFLFHRSIVVVIIIYFLYLFFEKNKYKSLSLILSIIGVLLVSISFNSLATLLTGYELFSKYTMYTNDISESVLRLNGLIIRIVFLAPILLYRKKFFRSSNNSYFLLFILIAEIIVFQLSTINSVFYRISSYFSIFKIFIYPYLCYLPSLKLDQRILKIVLIIVLIVIWVYQNVIQGNNEIFPYKFVGLL